MNQDAYLGIDVSKGYSDFVLINARRETLEPSFQLDDNRKGHDQLQLLIKQFQQRFSIQTFYCGLESTGAYENNWHAMLSELSKSLPLKVARLNPAVVKANRDAMMDRNTSDELSAYAVADYLIAHADQVRYSEAGSSKFDSLRRVYKYHQLLKKQAGQLNNQLQQLLYVTMPEALRFVRSGFPGWLLLLLQKYPTSKHIAKVRLSNIEKIPFIKKEQAVTLHRLANQSVASGISEYEGPLISSLAAELLHKREQIGVQKKVLESFCDDDRIGLLCSIPGIGHYTAVCMLLEIEDINRFATAKKLASYFGVHPVFKQSGDHTGAFRMSKKGRAGMRELLFLTAKTAARCDTHIKSLLEHHTSQGKKYRAAIGVIMHKMLRIVFGVLTSKTKYDAAKDQQQQQIKKPTVEDQQKDKMQRQRRYQSLNMAAPISTRNLIKRKALLKSQSCSTTNLSENKMGDEGRALKSAQHEINQKCLQQT